MTVNPSAAHVNSTSSVRASGSSGTLAPDTVSPHTGPVTINDVARQAGVSPMTVSNVVNGTRNVRPVTRQRVEAAIEATGYRANPLARALAGGRGRMLSVLVRQLRPYATEVIQGAAQAAEALGYDLTVLMLNYNSSADLSVMSRLSGGAMLIQPSSRDGLARGGLPAHLVTVDGPGERALSVDNYGGARLATEHLILLGHTRVGFVSGLGAQVRLRSGELAPDIDRDDATERLRGFHDAMREAGLSVPKNYVQQGDYSKDSGELAAGRLLGLKQRPTALFVSGDTMALGAMHAAQDRGLSVPGDLSIIGFDDLPIAGASRPALTTIRQPLFLMGETAVRLLVALAQGETPPTPPPFETALIERESTAPPQDGADTS